MPSWGVVATVKAPEEQVLAFIAHHLALGAARIWVYFDDPDDPAYASVSRLRRVTAKRCTNWSWALRGGRPVSLINRQIRNARHAQRKCRLDWLGHIDVDEFLHAHRPVADILGAVPPDLPGLLMEPFEAMYDPALPDDIFTARHFRGPLMGATRDLQTAIFGQAALVLSKGALSHVLGKGFCRIGFPDAVLRLHAVFVNKLHFHMPFHPDLRILHFHAQNPESWLRDLPFRLRHGAYSFPDERALKDFLTGASDDDRRAFYAETMTLTPEKLALLQAHDRLITADLHLRDKVADLRAGRLH